MDDGHVLATLNFTRETLPRIGSANMRSFDVRQYDIHVVAGQRYALTVRTPPSGGMAFKGMSNDPYQNGRCFIRRAPSEPWVEAPCQTDLHMTVTTKPDWMRASP